MATRNRTMTLNTEEMARFSTLLSPDPGHAVAREQVTDRVFHGDALAIMPHLPADTFDLLVTDPPYAIRKTFLSRTHGAMDRLAYQDYLDTWVPLVHRVMKPGASIYVCGDWRSSGALEEVLSRYFTLRNRITWEREKGRAARDNWKNASEDIWYCTKGSDFYFNAEAVRLRRKVIAPYRSEGKPRDWVEDQVPWRDTAPSNLLTDCTVPFWSMAENTPHPTQKPEKLMAKLILASSKPGDLVLDPFAGSGTTGVVARKLGRRFCMIEQEMEFAAYGLKRLEASETDNTIQGYQDGIFYDRNFGR